MLETDIDEQLKEQVFFLACVKVYAALMVPSSYLKPHIARAPL
jgi:hypothetical protein